MNRLFVVFALIVFLVLLVGFSRGWFSLTTQDVNDKSNVEFTVDKKNVRNDAETARVEVTEIGVKARDEAHAITGKSGDAAHSRNATLSMEKSSIELAPHSKQSVKVTRADSGLKMLQLGLNPSSGSNLLASGGLFKDGETETAVTVEAPANARDGSIAIIGNGEYLVLNVSTEPALVPVKNERDGDGLMRPGKPR